jgi:hypothetical protein
VTGARVVTTARPADHDRLADLGANAVRDAAGDGVGLTVEGTCGLDGVAAAHRDVLAESFLGRLVVVP